MYNRQIDEGRHMLHEHSHGAASWNEPEVQRLLARPGTYVLDQERSVRGGPDD